MSDQQTVTITAETVIKLPRGVRLHEDPVRKQMVLLAPERALALDEIAVAIVRALDGVKSLDQIADGFARDFGAPKDHVLADIIAFAQEFANRRMLEIVQ
ncbi:pyrroloquinoline quinone biosynthesis peptide chaperone PqqD [Rhizobium tumorigenes]|uniref:Pyrroloquinoline quinone biosynthesis peptide chaperone PqqD n=1 Tax=Rhizobium tumorigenes TaxID=2041385 RepID=A0AAF1KWC0_9HYPH|nr:pyrroloquinoline quinone biosynthesis peptide chaperone PqqD [Rhizobium tumorigenes]WFR96414.1 pyrroloquinoline quinone biosynthesis peptide chaperone PqqD [Rhizobium tumorigenes]